MKAKCPNEAWIDYYRSGMWVTSVTSLIYLIESMNIEFSNCIAGQLNDHKQNQIRD